MTIAAHDEPSLLRVGRAVTEFWGNGRFPTLQIGHTRAQVAEIKMPID
jgi:hypothetical protein